MTRPADISPLAPVVLDVRDLRVSLPGPGKRLHPVRGVSFQVEAGRTLCIVGESGCGKSMTAMGIMRLLPQGAAVEAGALRFGNTDILSLDERRMADLRGDRMAMIFQDPMTCLNPVYTIGDQLMEAYRRHRPVSKKQARERAIALLEMMGITAAPSRMGQYPHQLSGGLRQRVMIAMALMCDPKLLIADEPTTALDVTVQIQILHLLRSLQRRLGLALVLVTHDLGVVAHIADDVVVMYAGEIVEAGPVESIFGQPLHPYTRGLLDCIPVPGKTERGQPLGAIPGLVPTLHEEIRGCGFRGRCALAEDGCTSPVPERRLGPGRFVRCIRPVGGAAIPIDYGAAEPQVSAA